MVDNPYAVLGVREDADPDVIDAAYETLAEKTNPEHGGDPDKFDRIHEAYKQLNIDTPSLDPPEPVTVSDGDAEIALTGLYRNANLEPLTYQNKEERTLVALWDIKNTSDQTLDWNYSEEAVIADDGYQYSNNMDIALDNTTLPSRWEKEMNVTLEPGMRTNALALLENVNDADIDEIQITLVFSSEDAGSTHNRYTFEIPDNFTKDLRTASDTLPDLLST